MNKPLVIKDNTPEEGTEIQRQIAEDSDAWPTSPDAKVLKPGHPPGRTEEQVTVRIDKDVLALKKPQPKGWQTRLNNALRLGLKL